MQIPRNADTQKCLQLYKVPQSAAHAANKSQLWRVLDHVCSHSYCSLPGCQGPANLPRQAAYAPWCEPRGWLAWGHQFQLPPAPLAQHCLLGGADAILAQQGFSRAVQLISGIGQPPHLQYFPAHILSSRRCLSLCMSCWHAHLQKCTQQAFGHTWLSLDTCQDTAAKGICSCAICRKICFILCRNSMQGSWS